MYETKPAPVFILATSLLLACGGDSAGNGASTFGTSASSSGNETDGTDGTASGTSGGDTAPGGSSGGDSGGFLSEPDGGGAMNECDVWAQDCPAGEKCMPWSADGSNTWNGLKCSPVDPNPQQVGDPCTAEGNGLSGIDDCGAGAMCWGVSNETGMGVCVQLCEGSPASPTCADAASTCTITADGILPLCLSSCDPLLQDCPIEQDSCVLSGDGNFACEPNAAGDGGNPGDPCEFTNACQEGSICIAGTAISGCDAVFCCTPVCDASDPDASASCPGAADGDVCTPWYEDGTAPPGLDDVGYCGLPV